MSKQSTASDQDYERMLLSQGKRKLRIRLTPSRCGDIILLAFISVASFLTFISLVAQSISFESTRVAPGSNLTCTLFSEYTHQGIVSRSPVSCYTAIGTTTFVLAGLLIHFAFISIKCCAERKWGCLELFHALLGFLLLIACASTSIYLVIGFQHTCNSLIAANLNCDLISGVPYRDLMRQAPVTLGISSLLILFVELIFIFRTFSYFKSFIIRRIN